MAQKIKTIISLGTALLFIIQGAFGANDIPGSEDHPLVSRYPGSVICRYAVREFDEYVMPVASLLEGEFGAELTEILVLEGKVTQIQYHLEGRSTLEVYRNYESALKNAGFAILFTEQGRNHHEVGRWVTAFYDIYSRQSWASQSNPSFVGHDFRYLAAEMIHSEGNIYISLFVTTKLKTIIQLDIIEAVPMEEELVKVEFLQEQLARNGFVALYGIYFATGETEMLEDSRPVLDEIGKLLRENPEQSFYVVGHTDNIGSYEDNLTLSQKRAESVVRELVITYGVPEERLQAIGVGPVAPVDTNDTEEGRARNRRVELVVRRGETQDIDRPVEEEK